MAAPTLGLLNHTLINAADANTGWTILTTVDADLKKEGSGSVSGIFRTDATSGYYTGTTQSASGKHVRTWVMTNNLPYMASEANGGYEFLMYDGTNTGYKTIFGSDTYPGGWFPVVIDCALFTTLTLSNVQRWGIRCQHDVSGKNAINTWMDAIRYLDGYYATGGTSSDPITLATIAVADKGTTTLYGYGVILENESAYFGYGKLQIGNGATSTYFLMDGQALVFASKPVATDFYAIIGNGSGCTIVIKDSIIKSAGTLSNTRFVFDMSTSTPNSFTMSGSIINRAAAITFASGQSVQNNTFNDCGQITHGGATMNGCVVKGYEGTANTSALIYNTAVDPDGEMDNMEFTKGTAATHAIEFGTSSPTTMTLRGINFSGYNASNGQNDSTLHIKRTTGTVTINLIGCNGNISYRTDGATVMLVLDPVTVLITVKDIDTSSVIQGARILLKVSDGTNFPYNDSVTITSSGTTATVSHTAHGLVTNDWVVISGANQDAYNGVHQITKVDDNSYTYTMVESTASPATGTITATFAIIAGTTDVNGQISDSRTYASGNQPVIGWARKSTDSPYYKQQPISETVNSSTGLSITVLMIRDE